MTAEEQVIVKAEREAREIMSKYKWSGDATMYACQAGVLAADVVGLMEDNQRLRDQIKRLKEAAR